VQEAAFEETLGLDTSLVDPTLLRTRAFVAIAAATGPVAPFYPGNSSNPFGFRILCTASDDTPPSGWHENADAYDDVTFHPLIWNSGLWVPENTDFGRPEASFWTAAPAGGIADSQAMRKFTGTVTPTWSLYVGPLVTNDSGANPEFTMQVWIRGLFEATI
jgi:hypothetical protein